MSRLSAHPARQWTACCARRWMDWRLALLSSRERKRYRSFMRHGVKQAQRGSRFVRNGDERVMSHQSKRLLFINRFFYPDHSATSQLLTELTEDLAARGAS